MAATRATARVEGAVDRSTGVILAPPRRSPASNWVHRNGALAVAVVFAAAGRLSGIGAGLPAVYHPDEPTNVRIIERIVATGDLNPHFFNYPSLFFYLQSLVSLDGPLLGWLPGMQYEPVLTHTMGTSYATSSATMLLHRGLTVAFGVALVLVVWSLAREVGGDRTSAAGAAFLVAFSPTMVEHSRYVTPDMLAALLVGASVLVAVRCLRHDSWRLYALGGLLVGLSISAKYNAAVVGSALAVAFALRFRDLKEIHGNRVLLIGSVGVAAAIVGFVATTPYSVLDSAAFLEGLAFERAHYAAGHPGMEGGTISYYAGLLVQSETVICVLSALGTWMAWQIRRRAWRVIVVVGAFPLFYGGFLASLPVRNDRTFLLLLPFLAVLAGCAFSFAWRRLPTTRRSWTARVRTHRAALVLVLVASAGVQIHAMVAGMSVHHSRIAAGQWIEQHVSTGSTIVLESYSPWVDPSDYEVVPVSSLIAAEWPPDADYVIASHRYSGRYLDHPAAYPREAAAYAELFSSMELVQTFGDGAEAIFVYRP